jgi:carbonic anhydrase
MSSYFAQFYLLFFCSAKIASTAEYPWTFDNDLFGGPDFWGLVNKHWRMCTIGQMQSPINIDPSRLLFDPGLSEISIGKQQVEAELQNTGQLPMVTINETTKFDATDFIQIIPKFVNISGGPMIPYNYRLHHVIFHFGRIRDNEKGSEHTVDRVRFPAELQLLAYNSDLYENFTQAMTESKGLLGIAIIVDIGEISNVELRKLTVASQSVTYKDSKTILTRFHPSELLPNTKHYVTYEGSLTYPGCYETVTWIVMNNPIYITREDLSIWNDLQQTEIKQSNPVFMSPNYRPLKPLNNRLIRTNINIKYTSRNPGSCPSNIYLNNGYRSNPLKIKHLQKQPAGSRHARRSISTSSEGEDENNDAYDQAYTLSQFEIETSDNNNNENDRIDF